MRGEKKLLNEISKRLWPNRKKKMKLTSKNIWRKYEEEELYNQI